MKKVELIMDGPALDRALTRMTHQILERNGTLDNVGIVGMQTRGVFLAQRIAGKLEQISGKKLPAGILDVTFYRDDYRTPFGQPEVKSTDIPFDVDDMNIVLVDDVLYTGRTVRAALEALMDLGRPRSIQLAVLVDRGHRELPIRADYVGKELTTAANHKVSLTMQEKDGIDEMWLMAIDEGASTEPEE